MLLPRHHQTLSMSGIKAIAKASESFRKLLAAEKAELGFAARKLLVGMYMCTLSRAHCDRQVTQTRPQQSKVSRMKILGRQISRTSQSELSVGLK
jgi:hypothetical protein